MKKLLFALLILTLPLTAGAWTLPVPSGLTAGDQIYASDGSTLGNRGSLVTTCTAETWTAGASATMAGKSCVLVSISGNVTMTSISETGAVAGQILTIINVDATPDTLTINESAGVNDQAGNVALGQYDSITYIYTGSSWVQIGASNN